MENKVVIVTGANSGTGKWTAIELAKMNAQVVMVCRDRSRGEEALKEIKKISKNPTVKLMICDLANLDSVRDFCDLFKRKYDKLDVLVNNAGVLLPGRHETKNGYELQFGVNHLGHFLLTNLLLDLLIKSTPARIVVVASGAHKIGKMHFEDINLEHKWNVVKAYSQSKLANILFTYELARRLENTGVTVNALHPGTVKSNFAVNRDTGFGKVIMQSLQPFFQTAQKAASTSVYLSTSKEVEGLTGKYYYKNSAIESSKRSKDKEVASKLWAISESMVNTY
ncbi:MAG: SDR family oxidoreductase [Carnobacterium sp.]|nr:SDR family oxidoreductase [Carnobacterium sp.]